MRCLGYEVYLHNEVVTGALSIEVSPLEGLNPLPAVKAHPPHQYRSGVWMCGVGGD